MSLQASAPLGARLIATFGRCSPALGNLTFGVQHFSTSEQKDETTTVGGSIRAVEQHVLAQKPLPAGLGSGLLGARSSLRTSRLGSAMPWAAEQTRSMAYAPQVQSGSLPSSVLKGIYTFWRSQNPIEKPHAPVDNRMLPSVVQACEERAAVGNWATALFCTILSCNLLGLVPFNEAPTSGLGFATGLGVSVWATATAIGLYKLGFTFPGHFIPGGTPWPMAFIFVPLETISYTFRAVSLGVRLWVNMLAGHTLLHILTGMSLALPFSLPIYFGLPATVGVACLLSALVGLEYLVAVLQSGVFSILSTVYVGEFNSVKMAGPLAKVVKNAAH